MKNIKSIIVTLVITLILGSLLPTTTTYATTINPTNQNATLTCCNLAYNKILDFNTYSNTTTLNPQESANVDAYNTFIDTLEADGMNWDEIVNYIAPNNYNK